MKQIAISLIIVLGIFSLSFAQDEDQIRNIENQLNQLAAKVQLLDEQMQANMVKRQELNRQIGVGQRQLFELRQESEKDETQEPAEPGK